MAMGRIGESARDTRAGIREKVAGSSGSGSRGQVAAGFPAFHSVLADRSLRTDSRP
ncbi:MAG: hypothetical protein NTX75_04910 [Proteobacteria bacterium]|nr:hypothetical protein [Pseudomonadota bacterium]